jgi:hypothetical protein
MMDDLIAARAAYAKAFAAGDAVALVAAKTALNAAYASAAIAAQIAREKISAREAQAIHRLLRGRH